MIKGCPKISSRVPVDPVVHRSDPPVRGIFEAGPNPLVPKLQFGNIQSEAPASRQYQLCYAAGIKRNEAGASGHRVPKQEFGHQHTTHPLMESRFSHNYFLISICSEGAADARRRGRRRTPCTSSPRQRSRCGTLLADTL